MGFIDRFRVKENYVSQLKLVFNIRIYGSNG